MVWESCDHDLIGICRLIDNVLVVSWLCNTVKAKVKKKNQFRSHLAPNQVTDFSLRCKTFSPELKLDSFYAWRWIMPLHKVHLGLFILLQLSSRMWRFEEYFCTPKKGMAASDVLCIDVCLAD